MSDVSTSTTGSTAEEVHARVALGAAWLDKRCPDWFKEIKLDRLKLESSTYCVLGQTARCLIGQPPNGRAMRRGYYTVIEHLFGWREGGRWAWSAGHGFSVSNEGCLTDAERVVEFEMLDIAWKELIRTRLEVAA